MSAKNTSKSSGSSPATSLRDRAAKLTEKLVTQIENAVAAGDKLPWRKPWVTFSACNASGKVYGGLNQFILSCEEHADPRWYTFNKARELGGCVRKGEKGTQIFFWKVYTVKADSQESAEPADDMDAARKRFVLRTYHVFNYSQIEWQSGEPRKFHALRELDNTATDVERMAADLAAFGVPVGHGGDRAYYSPSEDRIQMPQRAAFETDKSYVATLAHEVVHATGHESRLKRDLSGRFGSDSYAMEELVAELGSAMLCARYGLEAAELDKQHAAYLKNWLGVLKKDPYALFSVSRMAQAACDLVAGKLGVAGEEDQEREAA